jgi:cardiolipin synthase
VGCPDSQGKAPLALADGGRHSIAMARPPASVKLRPVTVDGNRLALVPTGQERLDALLALVAGAKRDLRLLFYMFNDDAIATKVRDALVDAARRGVDISILLDGFGCDIKDPDFFKPIADLGGDYCIFHPRFGRRYLIRNHQKMVIADGARALIGGANVDAHYLRDGPDDWRDLWLSIDGPQVGPLAAYFDAVERWTKKPKARIRELRTIIRKHSQARGPLQWKFSGPIRHRNPWPSSIVRDIFAAESFAMIAAYFAPSWAMLGRLAGIARRGGTAQIVTAAKSDNNATIAAARFTYKRLLRGGVDMYEYLPAKLHTKLYVADDVVHIGSSNFDFRSLYLNLEMMLRIDDAAFASMVRRYIAGEIANSRQITLDRHRERATPLRRMKWAMSYFLVTSMDYTVTRRLNFVTE